MRDTILEVLVVTCVVAAFAWTLPACDNGCDESDSATCFKAPNEVIVAFEVTITTGEDPTTSDIFFCWQLKSTAGWTCREMDKGTFYNDFSIGSTDTYHLSLGNHIAPGDLERIRIGMDESDNHHDWELTQLTVVVVTASNRDILIYHDPDIDCPFSIDEGYSYWPRECPY